MYIEGNALILGDSSYLEHHGIRGQRWGVRRFQNRDGSLTNAGRKRLGYATKGVTQTVGKAFKAGVKAGGNAVKAVKAHHEKKEAEKLEKKKEKASKTRLGVMANKDLFTNEEIRKLNERFKLEDEMKMATLQKGVEIAKAVGTIAQNVGTVAKTYEDVTGQSLSPIKRKAAEEKAKQDAEDRERKIAREDAEEARKAAKEERDIALHEQTLRKAIAAADTQEFTAQKTKAEADSSVLDAIKKGQDFNGGSDATGQSWMEKATAGGKNPFFEEKLKNDPELAAAKAAHDAKVEQQRHEQERDARIAAREKEAAAKQSPPQQKQGGGDDDALFSQKGSLPIDKDRYRNNRAMEKAKQVKEDAAEERAKKQDEKAAKATIDDMMEARRQFTDSARANSDGAFDRETAANYIKGKAKELPSKLNPINAIAKKITNKALKEEEDNARKTLEDEYKKTSRSQGRDEANYTMYYNRVNALQAQGYSERQAKKVADTESPFSSKRNRRFEYNEKVGEIEATHRKNSKEINKANKELTDYYYKLINGPGYDPGTPKREALDRKYAQKRGELERLEKDNNDMLDREKKKAKKILEHSLTIQNGVLFINAGEPYLEHHGVKGMKWGKHLMAGKGEAGAGGGGGFAEDDEKLKEMAKKAGMSVAEYRNKFAKEISRMKTDSAERKEGSHWALAKADVYGTTENHMPLIENKHKDKNAKEAMINNARLAETKYKAQQAAQDYTRNHTNSQKDINKWRNAAYLDSSNYLHKELAEARTEKAQQYYKNSVSGKLDRAKQKAGSALREAKSALKEGPSGVGDRIYDAAGGKYKKQAASNTKAAREDVQKEQLANRMANQQRAREASEIRKKGGRASRDKGFNTVNGHDVIAEGYRNARQKHQKAASEANAKYEKSLAGRAEAAGKRARKAGNELSTKVAAAKKRLKDVPGELYGSKHRKDFERNARLLEGSTRSAVEIGRDTYKRHGPTSGFGDPTYKATDDAYKRANKQWNKARVSGQKYDRSIAKRVDSLVRKASKARKTTEQKKLFSGTSPKAKKAVIAKKKATPTSYEKRISDAQNSVEKAARANEAAYKHATEVHRQTGRDSDAYRQAIKRSQTTLWRSLDNQERLKQKKRRPADIGKKRAKHFDDTNAIYTEGTRLVVNSKWG